MDVREALLRDWGTDKLFLTEKRLIISWYSVSKDTLAMLTMEPLRYRIAAVAYDGVRSKPMPGAVFDVTGPLPGRGQVFVYQL